MRTFEGIEIPSGEKWTNLFAHFLSLDDHRKMPSTVWAKKSTALIQEIGREQFIDLGLKWLTKCIEKSIANKARLGLASGHEKISETLIGNNSFDKGLLPNWLKDVYGDVLSQSKGFFPTKIYAINNSSNYFYYSFGGRILRGFMHCSPLMNDKFLNQLVDKFVSTNPNECADAIHIYSQLPPSEGVPKLTRIRTKVKKKNIQTRVETALKTIGKKMNLSAHEVEELSIPDYDLNEKHELCQPIGAFKALFRIENVKKTTLTWFNNQNKEQNSVPNSVKNEFSEALKLLKLDIKEIENQLPVQKDRIERFYWNNRNWQYNHWFFLYISHPLIGIIAKSLIWHFDNGNLKGQGIWQDGVFVDSNLQPLEWIDGKTQVQLWHPLGFAPEYVLNWRNFLTQKEIVQPFKQAFREVYLLTDAEIRTHSYSNRFAGHILNYEQFTALCKARDWTPKSMGDGQPTKRMNAWNMSAEYWVQQVWLGQNNSYHGSAHVTTDQVRFYKNKKQILLSDVPAILFSEIMRDIDLFVGVTSIANDPNWQDSGHNQAQIYWNHYAFGELSESSKMRENVLKNMIPKLKIASQCSFEGKFLCIKGKIRDYKIHLGSGNILMQPNDQYLCIVPDSSKPVTSEKIYLPIEQDAMMSIILSKAMLLAADDKITDPTITRQIKSEDAS